MGKQNKENTAAEAVAVLQKAFDTAVSEQAALDATATPEVIESAKNKVDEAKASLDAEIEKQESEKPTSTKELEVEFLISPTGRFNLAYNVGEKASFPELQASELVEAGFAKFVK